MRPSDRIFRRSIFLLIILLFPAGGAASGEESRERQFWNWFKEHSRQLYRYEEEPRGLLDELHSELRKVNPGLNCRIDGIRRDGRRILLISAGGKKELFPAVRALYRASPFISGWKVFTFIPGRIHPRDYEYRGITVKSRDVRFSFFRHEVHGLVKVLLLIPGYTPEREKDYRELARRLLFDALGEYELATKVGAILLDSTDSPYSREAVSYQGLPTEFNSYWYGLRHPR